MRRIFGYEVAVAYRESFFGRVNISLGKLIA